MCEALCVLSGISSKGFNAPSRRIDNANENGRFRLLRGINRLKNECIISEKPLLDKNDKDANGGDDTCFSRYDP